MAAARSDTPMPERFVRTYGRCQSDAEVAVEGEVFGTWIGANGYTTIAEATRLLQDLDLGPDACLLEVGTGRGWPGAFLARESRCSVVLTDIPIQALRESLFNVDRYGVSANASVGQADGTALPFVAHSFDAVVHTDVL